MPLKEGDSPQLLSGPPPPSFASSPAANAGPPGPNGGAPAGRHGGAAGPRRAPPPPARWWGWWWRWRRSVALAVGQLHPLRQCDPSHALRIFPQYLSATGKETRGRG